MTSPGDPRERAEQLAKEIEDSDAREVVFRAEDVAALLSERTALVDRLERIADAARKYRTLALKRPGDDDYGYWEWLLRFNSAGNELSAALSAVSGDTQREGKG